MKEITKLHDLVELGIKLSKQELPSGFICTVWTREENREKIYSELLDYDVDSTYWKVEGKNFGAYNFKILGINFLLF